MTIHSNKDIEQTTFENFMETYPEDKDSLTLTRLSNGILIVEGEKTESVYMFIPDSVQEEDNVYKLKEEHMLKKHNYKKGN